jgi:hypothetical protein
MRAGFYLTYLETNQMQKKSKLKKP